MNTYAALKTKTSQFTASKSINEYPEESITKIAVLFTDIVSSSEFFKSFGDAAGRKMLRQHQEMASPAVIEHGGVVVKILGDSIMAYFSSPQEALKSAVKIQQKFRNFNQQKADRNQIHIRICVHFGDGIVEEKDIFGDVVNMAAKFLPLASGDQILISEEVYNHAGELFALDFQPFDLSNKKSILQGLKLYNVIWNEAVEYDPYVKTLLYFKPAWSLGVSSLTDVWNSLLASKGRLWTRKVEKEKILTDKSVVLALKDPYECLSVSSDIIQFLNSKLNQENLPFLPLQIIIDSGSYIRADKLVLDDLNVDWEDLKPGKIYISYAAYKTIGESDTFSVSPKPNEKHKQSFYELTLNDQSQDEPYLFLYQNALAQGEFPPCFYCGDRRHLPMDCPSKQLSGITNVISKIGYLPLKDINKLFFNYLSQTNTNDKTIYVDKSNRTFQWAYSGFHELKMVFQLRFLRELWSTREDSWNKLKQKKNEGAKGGGQIWLGQDCIRVSKLDQAEKVLSRALEKDPHDYRIHCAMGFLNVEKQDLLRAHHHFDRALDSANTRPQKIFAHFLLSRLHYLRYDFPRAQEHIDKILRIDRTCSEAVFQDIVFQFQSKNDTEALQKLIKLIRSKREYYIYALIDPELADYNKIIHPELENLFNEAQDEAQQIYEEAKEKAEKLEAQLTKEEMGDNNPKTQWLKIEELSKSDSYFSYLDIIDFGGSIINFWPKHLGNRRNNLLKVLNKLGPRIENYRTFINDFRYRNLIAGASRKLRIIQAKMDKSRDISRGDDPQQLREAFLQADELSTDLMHLELELKKLNTTQQMLIFISQFFKKTFLFLFINVILAFGLFPLLAHYLNFFLPGINITPQNIWEYQKIILVLGGFSSVCLALMLTTKNMPTEQRFPVHL